MRQPATFEHAGEDESGDLVQRLRMKAGAKENAALTTYCRLQVASLGKA